MIREVDEAKSMEKDAKIRQVFASLKLEHQDLANKIFVEGRTRVSVAEEEVISETAICKRLATIRGTYAQQYYVQNGHPQLFRRTLHASTERI